MQNILFIHLRHLSLVWLLFLAACAQDSTLSNKTSDEETPEHASNKLSPIDIHVEPVLHQVDNIPLELPEINGSSQYPHFAPDGEDLLLSWIENDHWLKVARWDGTTWQHSKTIIFDDALLANWADFPSVVSDQHGTWLAHWLIKRPGNGFYYDAYLSTSSDQGSTWSPPIKLHSDDTDSEHGFVSIASNAPGVFDIVWLDGRQYAQETSDPKMDFRYKRLENGRLSEAFIIDSDVCTCCDTSALYFKDELWTAYRGHNDQERRDIFVSKMSSMGQFEPVMVTEDHWTIANCPVNGPALSLVNQSPVLAWFTQADAIRRVHYKDLNHQAAGLLTFAVDETVGRVDLATWDDGLTALSHLIKTENYEGISVEWIHPDGQLLRKDILTSISTGRKTGFPKIHHVQEQLWVVWTVASDTGTSIKGAVLQRP